MSGGGPRAGILVTGTEVLTGIISDRNGPWLSERLLEIGVDAAMIQIVGDRPGDLIAALRYMAAQGMALIVTSGGLGPTADDLTAEIVGEFAGREMVLDDELEAKITEILRPLMSRWPGLDLDAIREANRKQAVVPLGATVLDPVGTAPGLVVPPASGSGPTVVVLPGPPRELQRCGRRRERLRRLPSRSRGPGPMCVGSCACSGYRSPRSRTRSGTLRKRASRWRSSRSQPACVGARSRSRRGTSLPESRRTRRSSNSSLRAMASSLFSLDGSTVDAQVASLLGSRMVAVAESCTGGLMSARLTELPGSSAYFAGGAVVYSNSAKVSLADVDPDLIIRFGAVSTEVAEALASGAAARFDAAYGIGITGIAGPDGGTEEKPVGTVCFSVCGPDGARITRRTRLPGSRSDVRDRSTTVAMHLLRRVLVEGQATVPEEGARAERA